MKNKITFGLVVYNEALLIRRCLESIRSVADEIIVIHDGPCTDATLDIAREFTSHVYVEERLGGSDPHRITILQQASNDWIFMIDADEFLSNGLKEFLETATVDPSFSAYCFRWPLWNGQRYVTTRNYRPCLFYRPKSWFIGLHNFSVQSVGPMCRVDAVLEHQPQLNKVAFSRFSGQFQTRIERDAKQFLKGYAGLPKFHEELIPAQFERWFTQYLSMPGSYAYWLFIKYFAGSLKNTWRDGYYGWVVSVQAGLYQYKLAKYIQQLKKA